MITEKTECQYCKGQLVNGVWIDKDVVYSPRFPRSKDVNSQPCPGCFDKQQKIIEEIEI